MVGLQTWHLIFAMILVRWLSAYVTASTTTRTSGVAARSNDSLTKVPVCNGICLHSIRLKNMQTKTAGEALLLYRGMALPELKGYPEHGLLHKHQDGNLGQRTHVFQLKKLARQVDNINPLPTSSPPSLSSLPLLAVSICPVVLEMVSDLLSYISLQMFFLLLLQAWAFTLFMLIL